MGDGAKRVTTERSDIEILWDEAALPTTLGVAAPRAAGGFSRAWLLEQVRAQADRWSLWAPAAFGCGCGLYFGLPREPMLVLLLGIAALAVAGAWGARRWGRAPVAAGVLLLLAFGACGTLAAKIQTLDLKGPVVPPMAGVTVEGCGIMAQTPQENERT